MHRKWLPAFVLLLTACGARAVPAENDGLEHIALVSPGGREIRLSVELADEPVEWQNGLMFRDTLENGMMFVFPDELPRAFWMKNTYVPLDALYFDARGEFDSVQTMAPCVKDPCPSYPSDGPARYVLEMPAGFAEDQGIGDGWIFGWQESSESSKRKTGGNQR